MTKFKISNAIISVSDKTNLELLIPYFAKNKISIYSSGGTFKFLKNFKKKITVHKISDYTKFPEFLDGRVKTLHPLIHGGILADKNNKGHIKDLKKNGVVLFDLVVINLYRFDEIISESQNSENVCLEHIDIGGPTILRAAAKNFSNVIVLNNPNQYLDFLKISEKYSGNFPLSYRKNLAKDAFRQTAYYDSTISTWFSKKDKKTTSGISTIPIRQIEKLRYGENPHQEATLYTAGQPSFTKLSGKNLSYNNILDSEIAYALVNEISESSCAIVKHGNPCGVSSASKQIIAYKNALNTDRESAFGGIIAFNREVQENVAIEITKLFTELVIAPKFSANALKCLAENKKLILIESKYRKAKSIFDKNIRSTGNFILIQDFDRESIKENKLHFVTKTRPNKQELEDLIFAQTVSKFMNSNAIVIVKNKKTLSLSCGQTSRVMAMRIATSKIKKIKQSEHKKMKRFVLASDGFFPFPDIVKLCVSNNICSIIQPGGSINDNKVIQSANKNKISMIFTGVRNFKH